MAVACLAAAACKTPWSAPPRAEHVVIVTLDTLRADRVGAYGAQGVATPNLDRIAREGAMAVEASTHVPLTRPAHVSLFTGLLPWQHGIRDNLSPAVVPETPLLAELLRAQGFETAAFLSSIVIARHSGLQRGFDVYADEFEDAGEGGTARFLNTVQKRGDTTLDEALRWLETRRGARVFLWLHLYDPHDPYEPPEPFASRYAGRPYDGEVAWTDELVGRLDAALARHGLKERTLLVIASDHGEGLGEHGETLHGYFVYQTTLAIPLLFRGPGIVPGGKLETVASLVDVMPTVLELAGVAAPEASKPKLAGRSLAAALRGAPAPESGAVYAESLTPLLHFGWSDLRVIRDGRWKYVQAPRPELFDLQTDPHEERNLATAQAARASALRGALGRILDAERAGTAKPTGGAPQPADLLEKLGALGYVGGGAPVETTTPGADPKDKIEEFRLANGLMREGLERLHAGDYAGARARFDDLIRRGIESFEAHLYLGRALFGLGRFAEAAPHFAEAARRAPTHAPAWSGLARSKARGGDGKGAVAALAEAQRALPQDVSLRLLEADVWLALEDRQAARRALEAGLPLAPKDASLRGRLGELLRDMGEVELALARQREAVELAPKDASLWNSLGMTLGGGGRAVEAERAFREAITLNGRNHRYHFNLGLILLRQGRPNDARPSFEKALALEPGFAPAREQLGKVATK